MFEALITKEPTFWLYSGIVLVSLIGFLTCVWWWFKLGRVTTMYKYITILFASMAIHHSVNVYARWLHTKDIVAYVVYLLHWSWVARSAMHLVVLLLVVVHLSYHVRDLYDKTLVRDKDKQVNKDLDVL